MTGSGDDGVGKEATITIDADRDVEVTTDDKQLIDGYLKKVEKNLKGFSRNAKDSILIEIRGHIQEKISDQVMEEGEDGDGLDTGEEGGNDVSGTLKEFGDPKEVADSYSATIQRKGWKLFAYQMYVYFISIIAIVGAIFETTRDFPTIFDGLSSFWIGIIVLFAFGHLGIHIIIQLSQRSFRHLSPVTLLSNSVFGFLFIIFLLSNLDSDMRSFFFLEIPLVPGEILWMQSANTEDHQMYLFGTILMGALAVIISTQGNDLLFKDKLDGISPMNNITMKLLPIICIFDLVVIIYTYELITTSFEYYFIWARVIGYLILSILIFIGISAIGTLLLRVRHTYHFVKIDKAVFGYFVISLLLLSIITGGFITDRIDLLENSADRGYFEENRDLELGWKHVYHNGSFYLFEEVEVDGLYQYELSRLDENLHPESPYLIIPSVDQINGSSNSDEIVRLNGYIHILSWVPRRSSDDENRTNCRYTFISISTSEIKIENFSIDRVQYLYHDRIVASGPDANILFSQDFRNETNRTVECMVIERYYFENGRMTVNNQPLINMSLSSYIPTWDHDSIRLRFVPGDESISIVIEARDHSQFHEGDASYFGTKGWKYFTRISYNTSILQPLSLIAIATSVSYEYWNVVDRVDIDYLSGFGDHVLFLRTTRNEYHHLVEYVMFHAIGDGSFEETILSSVDQTRPIDYSSGGWYAGRYGATDGNGNTFLPVINSERSNDTLNLTLEYFTIDRSGVIVENEKYSLSEMIAFAFAEDMTVRSEYEDIYFFFFTEKMIRAGHSKIITIECSFFEDSVEGEDGGAQFRYFVTIENRKLTFIEYGPEIDDDDNKDRLNYSIYGGIIAGLIVPTAFWWLLKRKSV